MTVMIMHKGKFMIIMIRRAIIMVMTNIILMIDYMEKMCQFFQNSRINCVSYICTHCLCVFFCLFVCMLIDHKG